MPSVINATLNQQIDYNREPANFSGKQIGISYTQYTFVIRVISGQSALALVMLVTKGHKVPLTEFSNHSTTERQPAKD